MASRNSSDDHPFAGDDLDDISVTSSQHEEKPMNNLYELESILAQAEFPLNDDEANEHGSRTHTLYLVKWKGYHEWESTLEPEEHFEQNKDDAMLQWQGTLMRQKRGYEEPLDLAAWEERVRDNKNPIYIRRKKRREKRRRLGLPLGLDPDEDEYFLGIRPLDDDELELDIPAEGGVEAEKGADVTGDVSSSDDARPLVSPQHRKRATQASAPKDQDYQQPLKSPSNLTGTSGSDSDSDIPLSHKRRKTITESTLTAAERTAIEMKKKKQPVKGIQRSKSLSEENQKKANKPSISFAPPIAPGGKQQEDDSAKPAPASQAPRGPKVDTFKGDASTEPATKPVHVSNAPNSSQLSTSSTSVRARGQSILGAASAKYRPGGTSNPFLGVHQPHKGAGIFQNEDKFSATKKRKRSWGVSGSENRTLYTYQIRNVANTKSMRKDRAPDIPLEQQQLLGTSKPVLPPIQTGGRSISEKNVLGNNHSTVFKPKDTGSLNGTSNQISDELNNFSFQQSSERPNMAHSDQTRDPKEGLVTCWFWENLGDCRFGRSCVLEHQPTGRVAFDNNRLNKDQATCPYWFRGHCNKHELECKFSHHRTAYVASDAMNRIQKYQTAQALYGRTEPTQRLDQGLERTASAEDIDEQNQRNQRLNQETGRRSEAGQMQAIIERYKGQDPFIPPKRHQLGCYFYNMESCNKSAESCKFRHEILPWLADAMSKTQKTALWNEKKFGPQPPREDLIADATRIQGNQGNSSPLQPPISPPFPPPLPLPPDSPTVGAETPSLPKPAATHQPPTHPETEATMDKVSPVPVALRLVFGENDARGLETNFCGFSKTTRSQFCTELNNNAIPECSHFCQFDDAKKFYAAGSTKRYADGDILPKANTNLLSQVEATLRSYLAAAVFFHPKFTLLVYPAEHSQWRILFQRPENAQAGAKLCFHICAPIDAPPHKSYQVQEQRKPSLEAGANRIECNENTVSGLIYERVLAWPNDGSAIEPNIFLMFHQSHQEEMDGLTSFFSEKGARVYQSTVDGSWQYFAKNHKKGAIIFDPDFQAFDQIEGLTQLLSGSSLHFNLWRLAYQNDPLVPEISKQDPGKKRHLVRLFPSGQAVFIMDDCFGQQPHDTLPALKALANRVRGNFASVILGRPGLLDWLRELAQEEENANHDRRDVLFGGEREDHTRAELLNMMASLVYPTSSSSRGSASAGSSNNASKSEAGKDKKLPSTAAATTFGSPEHPPSSSPITPAYSTTGESHRLPAPSNPSKALQKPPQIPTGKRSIAFPTHSGVVIAPSLPEYHNLLSQGKDLEACNLLAEWFAGWALANVGRYRRFIILSMVRSDMRMGWGRRWKHVQVLGPQGYVAEVERRGKGR